MTTIDTARLRALAEKRYDLLDADGDIQSREREAEILTLLDEIERLRAARQVWEDRYGTHWESLPNGDLRARIGARYTRDEAEESYGPLEPVEGDGDA